MGKVKTHFKPDFFIPGAAKSGTSTLHNLLNTHPEISMSRNKEPVYWNNKSFDKFNDFEKNRYEKMFDMNAKIKGESTTSYMYYDSYLKNIKKNYEKSPKFIFILRNPIDRYISHVNWMIGLGKEKNNLKQIIKEGFTKEFKEYEDYPKNYYQFGLYNKWITRFIENFGIENIKVISFESLISDRVNVINSCFEFLGVSKLKHVKDIRSNKTKKILFPSAFHLMRRISTGKVRYTKVVKYIIPKKIRLKVKLYLKYLLNNWISNELKNKKLKNKYRKLLLNAYSKDVKIFKNKLNYNFSEWKDFKNNK